MKSQTQQEECKHWRLNAKYGFAFAESTRRPLLPLLSLKRSVVRTVDSPAHLAYGVHFIYYVPLRKQMLSGETLSECDEVGIEPKQDHFKNKLNLSYCPTV